jgi:hypothetical protein
MITATANLRALLGDTFTYSDAKRAGLADRRLYGLRDAGQIIALGGGVYRWADAAPADFDLIEIAERVPRATLCLETALTRHGLVDAIPAAIDVAIPRGNRRPSLRAPIRLHEFDRRTFDLGRELLDVGARRSIIDLVRLRHLEGGEVAWLALRRWLEAPGRSPAQLIHLARNFPRAEAELRRALEVLL